MALNNSPVSYTLLSSDNNREAFPLDMRQWTVISSFGWDQALSLAMDKYFKQYQYLVSIFGIYFYLELIVFSSFLMFRSHIINSETGRVSFDQKSDMT